MATDLADGVFHTGCAAAGLLVWAGVLRTTRERMRRAGHAAMLVLGLVAFPGFDRWTDGGFLHGSELFHYVLGAKYFPELGYEGLYDATARAEVDLGLPELPRIRDLHTNRVEVGERAIARGAFVAACFSPERWLDFQLDVAHVHHELAGIEQLAVLDHGFNATPPWVALARPIVGRAPFDRGHLLALASIDVVLLLVALVAALSVFGLERTALAVFFTGTAYSFRFAWIGGSLLRFDWVVALLLAVVALRRERCGLAGGAIAWATASRIFPALFAVPVFVSLLARTRRGGERTPLLRFVGGYAIVIALAFLVGAASGRGPAGYREFAQRFETHRSTWASNHIGLESVVVADRILFAQEGASTVDGFAAYSADVERMRDRRRPLTLGLFVLATAAVALAARRLPPDAAMPLGAILCFSLATISGYYWVMLAPAPLVAPKRTVLLLVLVTFLHVLVELGCSRPIEAHLVVSVALGIAFVDWLAQLGGADEPSLVVEAAR